MSAEIDPAVGSRLLDEADLVIDLCTPARRRADRHRRASTRPVGPGSTIAAVAIVNSIKVRTAELLAERGRHAAGHHPGLGRRRRTLAGRCSTQPIESMRGGSPVRSTKEEVG